MTSNTYHLISTIVNERDLYQSVTALYFDPVSDTLWTGNNSGSVTAYHGIRAVRGVTFPVGGKHAVNKLQAGDQHVRACGAAGVGSWSKGGVNKWYYR